LDGNDSRDSNDVAIDPSPNYLMALTERKVRKFFGIYFYLS